jgi:AcrR family transcriptional regulator
MTSASASCTFTPQGDHAPLLRARRRPRQARSQMTVASLLDATALVLLRRGYAGCTTNLVAEVAGVGIGSLYEYFPNKESLVAALAEREIDTLLKEDSSPEARRALLELLAAEYPYFAALPAAHRLAAHSR